MIIRDFFTNKIHANNDEWADSLCAIAHVFSMFDGQPYDRDKLMEALERWAPAHRYSASRKDVLFRDEITAYMSHLGVCRIRQEGDRGLIFRLSKTAHTFLLGDMPDVGAFMRLQLTLLQIPVLMGLQYDQKNGRISRQVKNARDIFESMAAEKVKISPIRLLIAAINADSRINGNRDDIFKGSVSCREWYCLANQPEIYKTVSPHIDVVERILHEIKSGHREISFDFEHRISLLSYTELFDVSDRTGGQINIRVRTPASSLDRGVILRQIAAIESIRQEFDSYADYSPDAIGVIAERWANYHDAVVTLSGNTINAIASDIADISHEGDGASPSTFSMREFGPTVRPYTHREWGDGASIQANPDATRILKERRSFRHSEMVCQMYSWLDDSCSTKRIGDSPHIDLWANMCDGESYIFEIKSGGVNIHQQVRKGVSQLYEYRYRYREKFKTNPRLCLVVPQGELPRQWLPDYLCKDRDINVCYLDNQVPKFDNFSNNPIKEQ